MTLTVASCHVIGEEAEASVDKCLFLVKQRNTKTLKHEQERETLRLGNNTNEIQITRNKERLTKCAGQNVTYTLVLINENVKQVHTVTQ